MQRRNGIRVAGLLVAALVGSLAHAHGSNEGSFTGKVWLMQSGTSDGVYQYTMFWEASGEGHNAYERTVLQTAATNLGPWRQWQNVYGHYGHVFPAPLGVFNRAKFCHWTGCFAITKTSNAVWTPRRACQGGGGPELP